MKKKVFAIMMVCVLMVGGNASVVSAHGHGQHTKKTTVCTIKSCKKAISHKHSGKLYKPHKNGDGHSYHAILCKAKSCKKTSTHQHSGKYYKPHKNGDGHSYHAILCKVKSCKKTSTHQHDGKYYTAHRSNDGHSYHKNHNSGTSHKNGHH